MFFTKGRKPVLTRFDRYDKRIIMLIVDPRLQRPNAWRHASPMDNARKKVVLLSRGEIIVGVETGHSSFGRPIPLKAPMLPNVDGQLAVGSLRRHRRELC